MKNNTSAEFYLCYKTLWMWSCVVFFFLLPCVILFDRFSAALRMPALTHLTHLRILTLAGICLQFTNRKIHFFGNILDSCTYMCCARYDTLMHETRQFLFRDFVRFILNKRLLFYFLSLILFPTVFFITCCSSVSSQCKFSFVLHSMALCLCLPSQCFACLFFFGLLYSVLFKVCSAVFPPCIPRHSVSLCTSGWNYLIIGLH